MKRLGRKVREKTAEVWMPREWRESQERPVWTAPCSPGRPAPHPWAAVSLGPFISSETRLGKETALPHFSSRRPVCPPEETCKYEERRYFLEKRPFVLHQQEARRAGFTPRHATGTLPAEKTSSHGFLLPLKSFQGQSLSVPSRSRLRRPRRNTSCMHFTRSLFQKKEVPVITESRLPGRCQPVAFLWTS